MSSPQAVQWRGTACPSEAVPAAETAEPGLAQLSRACRSPELLLVSASCPSDFAPTRQVSLGFGLSFINIWLFLGVLGLCGKALVVGSYRSGFCEKFLEAFPMSTRATASQLQDRLMATQG